MRVFTDQQFVTTWLEALHTDKNQSWIAEQLDITRQAVTNRKQALTKAGVRLPTLKKVKRCMSRNTDALNELIKASLANPDKEEK